MNANYHNNSYVRKAREKALLDGALEAKERRKRMDFLYNLLAVSILIAINNWNEKDVQGMKSRLERY